MIQFAVLLATLCAACAPALHSSSAPVAVQAAPPATAPAEATPAPRQPEAAPAPSPCAVARSAASNQACYHLSPGSPASKDKKGKTIRPGGMCQPQSLIYARCRSGIQTCKLGNTSPEGWFACAKKAGATTATPQAGSVMVLAANKGRKIYTGHPVYVEEVCRQADGTWRLVISHTNYDRQCHLDHNAVVRFDPSAMTASFQTGPWAPWAKGLRVLGFITR